MSTFEIKMPKLGESITEGTIISWSVKVGDFIQEDRVLFEVNTAKVSAEIPSPVAGKITRILAKEGETIAVGTVVAIVDTEMTDAAETASTDTPSATMPEPVETPPVTPKPAPVQAAIPAETTGENRWYSPAVLQTAQEGGIAEQELQQIEGTGYLGRLTKKDLNDYILQKKKGNTPTATPVPPTQATSAPAARPAPGTEPGTPAAASSQDDETREMDYVRRIIADHMIMSQNVSAHVTNVLEADVTRLVRWRESNKETFLRREGIPLTYMPAITQAVAKALAEFPTVNASVEGYKVILKKHINIGIAVSLPDDNLIVPVIHDAGRMNVNGLARAIESLAEKARGNKLQPSEIEGGTFTITNFGSFKSLFGTPIINQPQVAILGVGYIEKKPAVVTTPEGDVIAIRNKMYLSLSFDHRIIDGALGSKFLRRVADYLENWNG